MLIACHKHLTILFFKFSKFSFYKEGKGGVGEGWGVAEEF
jgi:hypothetical protein